MSLHIHSDVLVYSLKGSLLPVNVACSQTVTEKHKLNVPETMTEVLDVSDEEGK